MVASKVGAEKSRQIVIAGTALVAVLMGGSAVLSCASDRSANGDVTTQHVVVDGGIGGPATRGDWDAATAESHVHCGLDDVEHEDIGSDDDDAVSEHGWDRPQPDVGHRCGDDYETLLFRLLNCERQHRNLEPLACDLRLVWAGREHSMDMADRDYFSHVTPEGQAPGDRLTERGVQWRASAENIAMSPTMALGHTAWMQSDGHRENVLLEEITHVGIGVIETERGYVMTALFAGLSSTKK